MIGDAQSTTGRKSFLRLTLGQCIGPLVGGKLIAPLLIPLLRYERNCCLSPLMKTGSQPMPRAIPTALCRSSWPRNHSAHSGTPGSPWMWASDAHINSVLDAASNVRLGLAAVLLATKS